ncbi:glycerol kinase [Paenibacillus marchantiophytorum]|uniref:ATP:glycerol 3-phosphotransferase n=1 Tax=Paenibacillus marchantiophytorum TaxID=1619310 RepID=A0ABQ1EY70_9BACL|nr:glycerol kinase GlpK [Paenibacillus marchantiophytorum]GFZ91962.1 glycerol kinase [Paenibacillus marchantiophytorum]
MRNKSYLLAIDQSTSGTKALIVDREGTIITRSTVSHVTSYPKLGWVEQDPIEIYNNVKRAAHEAMSSAGIGAETLAALTITNQRETAVIWDRMTGLPVYQAIVWQCQRTADLCAAYQAAGLEDRVRSKTGLMLDPYFSAAKWRWILQHVEGVQDKLAAGYLLAGTMDSWLIWKLTGGHVHATDYTNASRTSLFNIHTLEWDEELCSLFEVPRSLLPEVKSSDAIFGYTEDSTLFGGNRVPITGVIGDSQAALFGNQCFRVGMAKATYGTGSSVLMNVGDKPVQAGNGLVSAIAWGIDGKVTYAVEAVIRTSGDCLSWVRDNLGLFSDFVEMEELLQEVPDSGGVYLVPAFVGLGAPYWDSYARASITGMNRGTNKAHIIRAALESIAYQVYDAVKLIEDETGIALQELRADGGGTSNDSLMKFQSDLLGKSVRKSEVAELSSLGSAYIGGISIGFWTSMTEITSKDNACHIYTPTIEIEVREAYCAGWKKAVNSVLQEKAGCRK